VYNCNKTNGLGFAGIVGLTVLLLAFSPAHGGTLTENFTDNQYDTKAWRLFQDMGTGAAPQVINNRLEITVTGEGYAVFHSRSFTLIGDFDMQVDFTLLDWPASNGMQLFIGTTNLDPCVQVGRANAPYDTNGQEVYFASMNNYNNTQITGPLLSGTLRMVRTGDRVEGFYWDGADWQSIGAATDASRAGRTGVSMGFGPAGNGYSGIPAKAAFSNIRIIYTTLGPAFQGGPAPSGLLLTE
jgi:hypothetical protein